MTSALSQLGDSLLPPHLKLSTDTQHSNREDPGDTLGSRQGETHSAGSTAVIKHLKAVGCVSWLTATSISKQFQCTHRHSLTSAQANRAVGAVACAQTP